MKRYLYSLCLVLALVFFPRPGHSAPPTPFDSFLINWYIAIDLGNYLPGDHWSYADQSLWLNAHPEFERMAIEGNDIDAAIANEKGELPRGVSLAHPLVLRLIETRVLGVLTVVANHIDVVSWILDNDDTFLRLYKGGRLHSIFNANEKTSREFSQRFVAFLRILMQELVPAIQKTGATTTLPNQVARHLSKLPLDTRLSIITHADKRDLVRPLLDLSTFISANNDTSFGPAIEIKHPCEENDPPIEIPGHTLSLPLRFHIAELIQSGHEWPALAGPALRSFLFRCQHRHPVIPIDSLPPSFDWKGLFERQIPASDLRPLTKDFKWIAETPWSYIGRGRLKGEKVLVSVQRPGIRPLLKNESTWFSTAFPKPTQGALSPFDFTARDLDTLMSEAPPSSAIHSSITSPDADVQIWHSPVECPVDWGAFKIMDLAQLRKLHLSLQASIRSWIEKSFICSSDKQKMDVVGWPALHWISPEGQLALFSSSRGERRLTFTHEHQAQLFRSIQASIERNIPALMEIMASNATERDRMSAIVGNWNKREGRSKDYLALILEVQHTIERSYRLNDDEAKVLEWWEMLRGFDRELGVIQNELKRRKLNDYLPTVSGILADVLTGLLRPYVTAPRPTPRMATDSIRDNIHFLIKRSCQDKAK